MADSDHHIFNFKDATAELGNQPATCGPGTFPLLMGIDGRFRDVLRRYPGHQRYADANAALGNTTTAAEFFPDYVVPFDIQKQKGSVARISGFAVYNAYSGGFELWYKFDTDADGVIRKYTLSQTGNCAFRVSGVVTGAGAYPMAGGVGEPTTAFNSSAYPQQQVRAWCVHDDGTGESLYAAGIFRVAGDRHCQCVARWDGETWWPLANSYFNGTINALASYGGKLYVGGAFTKRGTGYAGSSTIYNRMASWDRTSGWATVGGGVDGEVRCMLVLDGKLFVGGDFANTYADATAEPLAATAAVALASWDGSVWTSSTIAQTNPSVWALAGTGTTLYVGGTFTDANANAAGDYIFQCDTSFGTFAVLGTGAASSGVAALYLDGTTLYAGGSFTGMGGVANTQSIAKWSGGAWSAVGNGFTSGTVRTIGKEGSVIFAAGSSLVFGGNTRACWALVGTWTSPTSIPTTITDIYCQQSWGSFVHFGAGEMGSSFTYNPLATAYNAAGTSPLTTAPKVDVTSHDRYIFLLASNGVKKVLEWDPSATTFKVSTFGPGLVRLDGITNGSYVAATTGSGRLIEGNYQTFQRFFDPYRRRYTGLSDPNVDVTAATPFYITVNTRDGLNELNRAPDGYTQAEIFSTISSLDADVAAGGTIYRVGRGSIDATPGTYRRIYARVGYDTFFDNGNGWWYWAVSDAAIPDPAREYNEDVEQVGELSRVAAVCCYAGVTFALEDLDGQLQLRWSNSYRSEWESFPPLNSYSTGIRSDRMWSCRFIVAGDYLYLIGGDQVFRIQRVGTSISIIRIFSKMNILHCMGAEVVGMQLFIATKQGLLVVDPRSGSGGILDKVSRVFWDRWISTVKPADPTASVSLAYDAQMECLYVHNHRVKESLCLWVNSGKVSLLGLNSAECVVSAQDLDANVGQRAYFFSRRRWFSYPQFDPSDSSQAMTMLGEFLYSGSTAKYNAQIKAITLGDTGCPTPGYSSGRTKLRLGTGSSGQYPFTTDGTNATTVNVAPFAVIALSGTNKGKVYQVVGNDHQNIWLATAITGFAVDDVLALAPVPVLVVGSMLWNERGQVLVNNRKKVKGHTLTVSRITSNGSLAATTPTTGSVLTQFGTARQDNLVASDKPAPASFANFVTGVTSWFGLHDTLLQSAYQSCDGPTGSLSTDKEAANWARKTSDGTLLFPWFALWTSNYAVEVLFWDVLGTVEASMLAGAGTL